MTDGPLLTVITHIPEPILRRLVEWLEAEGTGRFVLHAAQGQVRAWELTESGKIDLPLP